MAHSADVCRGRAGDAGCRRVQPSVQLGPDGAPADAAAALAAVLSKRELFRIWLLGPAMRTAGMIEVNRASPDLGRIDQTAARSLTAGHSLLVYPEGTTSPDGTIGEFRDGAFIVAVASQVPVLPVAIHGTCLAA